MNNQLQTYLEMQISGLNQKELIVLLYSRALTFIEEGRQFISKNDVPGSQEKLSKARNIFIHLLSTLDMEAGGELSTKLSALYAYFVEKITMANVTRDVELLDEIVPLIEEIKEAWEKMTIADIPAAKKFARTGPIQVFSAEV